MATKLNPLLIRDLSKGRYSSAVNTFLVPAQSVSETKNFNYDEVIGSAVVRKGTTQLGGNVAFGFSPLGMSEFIGKNGTPNLLISVFKGLFNATLYYFNGAWNTSTLTTLSNTARNRFASLGGKLFRVNGVTAMNETADGNNFTTTNSFPGASGIPTLVVRSKERLLCAGINNQRDRVYFSSIVDPIASPFITWNTSSTDGDWIDINPDDSDNITAFADTSNQLLVFKSRGMYRLNVISKATDVENIYNVGAVSQEAVTSCQGKVYFYSGRDIRRTDGGYPEQLTRVSVQDYLDAIPQNNKIDVHLFNDEYNVYASIGTVTVNSETFNNVILKFSTRDESWSVHSYAQQFQYGAMYTNGSNDRATYMADTTGIVQQLNFGSTDNGQPIFYSMETQSLQLGNFAHSKQMTDKIAVFTENGMNTEIQFKQDDQDWVSLIGQLNKPVNILRDINIPPFNQMKFRIQGSTSTTRPVFVGLYSESIEDLGIIH